MKEKTITGANIFYVSNFNIIGGIETFIYELARKYSDYDITVVYKTGDQDQLERLRKHVKVRQYQGQKIKAKKAFFNYSDMNRLEANAKYLSDLLAEIGYNLPYTITKTWTLQDIPKFSQLEKIRKYVEDVIKIIPLNNNTIVFPSTLNKMNYVVLNNLEKAMYVLTANIKSIKTAYKYSGEIYSGEE